MIHDFREVTGLDEHSISDRDTHTDYQTRHKVLSGWLLDWVINDLTLNNRQFHLVTFLKQCDRLGKSFPIHEQLHHIDEIRIVFWERYQYKIKILHNQLNKLKHFQVRKDLEQMRFL